MRLLTPEMTKAPPSGGAFRVKCHVMGGLRQVNPAFGAKLCDAPQLHTGYAPRRALIEIPKSEHFEQVLPLTRGPFHPECLLFLICDSRIWIE